HVGLRRLAAHSPHLPAGLVALLAADEDFVVRLLLSEHHPDPPGDLLLAVALASPSGTRPDRVCHPNFPSAGLARLARSGDPVARALALRDPALGPADVERLSRDADPAVRSAAARDERLPAPRLQELLDDPEAAGSAARNPGLPEASMKRILYDVAIICHDAAVVRRAGVPPRPPGHARYLTGRPVTVRPMTRRWISLVPSKIVKILASRCMRSTGYSRV